MAIRPQTPGVIDLPEDFRDLLIELHDAGAEFVVLGGHAVAYHGHPRATKDLDVLVRASAANAARVYKAPASFGAPLRLFEVGEADFATYYGVLQIGLPPRRIDILNRADGITFDEAIDTHESFGPTHPRHRPGGPAEEQASRRPGAPPPDQAVAGFRPHPAASAARHPTTVPTTTVKAIQNVIWGSRPIQNHFAIAPICGNSGGPFS